MTTIILEIYAHISMKDNFNNNNNKYNTIKQQNNITVW